MGYGIYSGFDNNKFVIKDVTALLKRVNDNRQKISGLRWVNYHKVKNLDELSDMIRWEFRTNTLIRYITGIQFEDGNLGDDFEFFKIIADLVEDDSWIEVTGEDGEKWRWVFKNGTVEEIHPKLVW
jgi:hypothetical protein